MADRLPHRQARQPELENQGFNNRYGMEHIRHHEPNSMLINWLLVALALVIERLYRCDTCTATMASLHHGLADLPLVDPGFRLPSARHRLNPAPRGRRHPARSPPSPIGPQQRRLPLQFLTLIDPERLIDLRATFRYYGSAGWSSLVARWAHNPKVVGSNPTPATNPNIRGGRVPGFLAVTTQ